jgi:hypothetical protein
MAKYGIRADAADGAAEPPPVAGKNETSGAA